MRALTRLSLLASLLTAALVPALGHAAGVEAHQAEIVYADLHAPPASRSGALLFVAFAAGAVGIVVRLRAKQFGGDGEYVSQSFELDSEADNYADVLEAFSEAKVEEGAGAVRLHLSAVETARDSYRGIVIGEILRVQKLTAEKPDDYNVETERAYLQTLRPEHLKLHFDKARAAVVAVQVQTEDVDPADLENPDEEAFGHVRLS